MMQPSPEVKLHGVWNRLSLWVSQHRAIARLVSLTAGLILFLTLLPATMRIYFWDGLLSHKILASMLFVFSLLAISLVWSAGQQLDDWAFLVFNLRGSRPIWLDRTMLGFTQIGNGLTILVIGGILFVIGQRFLSYELILGTLTLWLLVELVKFLVHRARPFILLVQTRIVGFRATGRSFPSGHTSQAFFIATLVAQHFHPSVWIVFLLYGVALLVGITRMYVGAHYPRDVLAGAILGSAWGLLEVLVNGYFLNGLS
jgi:membrane-associated phospholipid phosphatase